jgi:peptidoglycan/LPS O-acetylase OafA/YrhL
VKGQTSPGDRLRGLDSIRFLCAFWVFCYHYPIPLDIGSHSGVGLVVRGLFGNLWCGPAAVIIFFVVSGFCIHYPITSTGRWPGIRAFYARRFLRLLPPVGAAMILGQVAHVHMGLLQVSVLWSLLAELIYYLIYPALLLLRGRAGGWLGLIAVAYAVSVGVILTYPMAMDYPSYGPYGNWLVGLPCWLLGCLVAETVSARRSARVISRRVIWQWRVLILGLAVTCSFLRFHASIGFPWSVNVFAVPAAFWLHREILYFRTASANRTLEWAGKWSYSLYLVHIPVAAMFTSGANLTWTDLGVWWVPTLAVVLLSSYLFYLVIELPSHMLARAVARRLRWVRGTPEGVPAVVRAQ